MGLNIGIAGVGSFARFAGKIFSKINGIKIIAVTDINEVVLNDMAEFFNAKKYERYETFLEDKEIDLVYIATPPYLHYEQSKKALLKGKHVICEKPAALEVNQANELATLAKSLQLLWVVNLMQRYNPMYIVVKKIIEEKMLGNFLHGFFENYASDENLKPAHWFWDETKSGGIFIEHGVHFFDMFEGWLGNGKLIAAFQLSRPGFEKEIIDRVQATVLYMGGIVNIYHGFDQPKILDRQEMRLQFEHGEITLYEWVPVKIRLHGLLQNDQLEKLGEYMKDISIENENTNKGNVKTKGRFQDIVFDTHITIESGNNMAKQECYEKLLIDMIQDQWDWIKNRSHKRVIDEHNAIGSLEMAVAANNLAKKSISYHK